MAHFDLIDLELLAAVAETGSITRGAARVHMTLASASQRIRQLEQRAQLTLFERGPRGVAATAAGRRLLARARKVLAQADALQSELSAMAGHGGAPLRLWCNTAAMAEWVPARLAAFLREHPQTEVEVASRASTDTITALHAGRCDVGVVSDAADSQGLHCVAVRADPLDLILPAAHPRPHGRSASLHDLADAAWIGLAADAPLQRWIEHHAHGDGHALGYRLRLGTLDAVCRMVGEGVGIAIVPRATALRRRRDGFRRVPLREAWAQRGLQVCVRDPADAGPALRALLARLT